METRVPEKRIYKDRPRHVIVTPEVHAKLSEMAKPPYNMTTLATMILSEGLAKLEQADGRTQLAQTG
jgi:hypothetical protein